MADGRSSGTLCHAMLAQVPLSTASWFPLTTGSRWSFPTPGIVFSLDPFLFQWNSQSLAANLRRNIWESIWHNSTHMTSLEDENIESKMFLCLLGLSALAEGLHLQDSYHWCLCEYWRLMAPAQAKQQQSVGLLQYQWPVAVKLPYAHKGHQCPWRDCDCELCSH